MKYLAGRMEGKKKLFGLTLSKDLVHHRRKNTVLGEATAGLGKQRTEMRSKGRHDHQSSTARDQPPRARPHVPEIPHFPKYQN